MKRKQNPGPGQVAREVLARNLTRLMEDHEQYNSNRKLGKQAKVGDGSIGFMLHPEQGNPTIDNIAKVAAVFQLEPWQILHPDMPKRALSDKELALLTAIENLGKR